MDPKEWNKKMVAFVNKNYHKWAALLNALATGTTILCQFKLKNKSSMLSFNNSYQIQTCSWLKRMLLGTTSTYWLFH